MYKAKFKVTLEEPVIVSSKDKTESSLNCLDYIPGNIFLGMVAGELYDEKDHKKTKDLFHNGEVQFGNAYLSKGDIQSKPMPAVWYVKKGEKLNESIYFYHQLEDNNWQELAQEGTSIKQVRNGYFIETDDNNRIIIVNAKKGVVLKSAYESDRRSAEKEKMYLYEYLEAGQEFIFEVLAKNDTYLNEIKEALAGKKHISKSKSSEFGGITIECIKEGKPNQGNSEITPNNKGQCIIYAESNLAFYNEFNELTWSPTAEDLGITGGEIDYEKSQLLFDKFHTRNGKRGTHDADRLIIKKGSVFIINGGTPCISKIENGVGLFLSEGYGRTVVNPKFIENVESSCIEYVNNNESTVNESELDNPTNNLLKDRFKKEENLKKMHEDVAKFIDKHEARAISHSQWGAIRSLIYRVKENENANEELYKLIFDKTTGYIYHGRMAEKWSEFIRKSLKEFIVVCNQNEDGQEEEVRSISDENMDKLLLLTIEIAKKN